MAKNPSKKTVVRANTGNKHCSNCYYWSAPEDWNKSSSPENVEFICMKKPTNEDEYFTEPSFVCDEWEKAPNPEEAASIAMESKLEGRDFIKTQRYMNKWFIAIGIALAVVLIIALYKASNKPETTTTADLSSQFTGCLEALVNDPEGLVIVDGNKYKFVSEDVAIQSIEECRTKVGQLPSFDYIVGDATFHVEASN